MVKSNANSEKDTYTFMHGYNTTAATEYPPVSLRVQLLVQHVLRYRCVNRWPAGSKSSQQRHTTKQVGEGSAQVASVSCFALEYAAECHNPVESDRQALHAQTPSQCECTHDTTRDQPNKCNSACCSTCAPIVNTYRISNLYDTNEK